MGRGGWIYRRGPHVWKGGVGGGCDLGGVRGLLRNGVVMSEGRKQTLAGDALRREGGARGGGGPLWEGRGGGGSGRGRAEL